MEICQQLEVRWGINRTDYSAWTGRLPFLRPSSYSEELSGHRRQPILRATSAAFALRAFA